MTEQEYQRLKEQAGREYRLDLEAIERVRRMTGNLANGHVPESHPHIAHNEDTEQEPIAFSPRRRRGGYTKGSVSNAARAFIKTSKGPFTIHEVMRAVEAEGGQPNINTIRSLMRRLVSEGAIELLSGGIGRTPAKYKTIG
jgi:hypothetical protein